MTSKRILIVEDSMDVGRMLQSAVKTLSPDFTVTWIRSAEEAILETSRQQLDLLITDIRLPGVDGFELIRRTRKRLPDLRVVIISGLPEHELEKQVRDTKPDAFLRKPVVVSTFLSKVQAIFEIPAQAAEKPAGQAVIETPPAADAPVGTSDSKLSALLAGLQQAVQARMVLLVDAEGVPAADVGAPRSGLAVELKKVRDVLTAADGLSLTGRRGQVILRGAQGDWILQPLGREFTLAMLIAGGGSPIRLALALEEMQRCQAELEATFGAAGGQAAAEAPAEKAPEAAAEKAPQGVAESLPAGQPVAEPAQAAAEPEPEPIPEDPAALEAFAALFGPSEGQPAAQDADAFWESAAGSGGTVQINPSAITFDEAQQMGLTPDDENPA